MNVEVWSDIVSPLCYIGKRNLDEALSLFAHRDGITVIWRSFEQSTETENSFDSHRLVQLAAKFGLQTEMVERLMRAHLTEGRSISEHQSLLDLAAEVGIDDTEVREMLGSSAFTDDVRVQESTARDLGVGDVPFFVIDRRYAVAGAQPAHVLLDTLQQAWDDTH